MEDIAKTLTGIYAKIQPYLAKTVFIHSEFVDKYVSYLAANSGLREDAAKIMITMILSYPVSLIHSMIKNPQIKKILSIVFGVVILQFCFQEAWIHSVIQTVFCYMIMMLAPSKIQPYCVFGFTLSYMSICMIYALVTDYMGWACDSTVYQMILVIKFSSLAFDLYDGTYDKAHAEEVLKTSTNPKEKHRYTVRQETCISALPPLLDYFAYSYHFAGLLGGPTIFYREYLTVMNNEVPKVPNTPNRYVAVLKCVVSAFALFGVWGYLTSHFPVDFLVTPEYAEMPLWKQFIIIYITGVAVSVRYMALWKLGEGICVMDGFGFQMVKGHPTWDGVSNINVFGFLGSQDIGEATRNWNLRTQKWLSRYVYQRTHDSLLAVYFVSAFWHGFYPGYYCSFLSLGFGQFVNRLTYSRLYLRVKDNYYLEKLYCVLSNICCLFYGTYCVNAHFLMSYENVKKYWSAVHFIPHIVIAIGMVILFCIPPVKVEKSKRE